MLPVFLRVLDPRTSDVIVVLVLFEVAQPVVLVIRLGPLAPPTSLMKLLQHINVVSRLFDEWRLSLHAGRQLLLTPRRGRSESRRTWASTGLGVCIISHAPLKNRLRLAKLGGAHAARLMEVRSFEIVVLANSRHQPSLTPKSEI